MVHVYQPRTSSAVTFREIQQPFITKKVCR